MTFESFDLILICNPVSTPTKRLSSLFVIGNEPVCLCQTGPGDYLFCLSAAGNVFSALAHIQSNHLFRSDKVCFLVVLSYNPRALYSPERTFSDR